ncbi:MAG: hypothetical protein ABIW49_09515 [Knoellia sp.]
MRINLSSVLALAATLLVALSVPSAQAAQPTQATAAAGLTYSLSALTVEGSITPTSKATVRFAFDGAFPRTINANFVNREDGTLRRFIGNLSYHEGSRTIAWDSRYTAGRYDLMLLWLDDGLASTPVERYEADGEVYRGTEPIGSHALDFTTLGFSIDGPVTGEFAPPHLLDADLVSSGGIYRPFSLRLRTEDSLTTLRSVRVDYTNATSDTGDDLSVTRSEVPVVTATIDGYAPTGKHQAQRILIIDHYGSFTTYFADGRVVSNYWTFPEKHTIDFSALNLDRTQAGPIRHKPLRSRASLR